MKTRKILLCSLLALGLLYSGAKVKAAEEGKVSYPRQLKSKLQELVTTNDISRSTKAIIYMEAEDMVSRWENEIRNTRKMAKEAKKNQIKGIKDMYNKWKMQLQSITNFRARISGAFTNIWHERNICSTRKRRAKSVGKIVGLVKTGESINNSMQSTINAKIGYINKEIAKLEKELQGLYSY